jgi:hypothetical protein
MLYIKPQAILKIQLGQIQVFEYQEGVFPLDWVMDSLSLSASARVFCSKVRGPSSANRDPKGKKIEE